MLSCLTNSKSGWRNSKLLLRWCSIHYNLGLLSCLLPHEGHCKPRGLCCVWGVVAYYFPHIHIYIKKKVVALEQQLSEWMKQNLYTHCRATHTHTHDDNTDFIFAVNMTLVLECTYIQYKHNVLCFVNSVYMCHSTSLPPFLPRCCGGQTVHGMCDPLLYGWLIYRGLIDSIHSSVYTYMCMMETQLHVFMSIFTTFTVNIIMMLLGAEGGGKRNGKYSSRRL